MVLFSGPVAACWQHGDLPGTPIPVNRLPTRALTKMHPAPAVEFWGSQLVTNESFAKATTEKETRSLRREQPTL